MPRPSNEISSRHGAIPDSWRTVVSLLLFMHLFCVLIVVLTFQGVLSPFLARLKSSLRPYTQTFALDPELIPFYLTDASRMSVDHFIEVDVDSQDQAPLRIEGAAGWLSRAGECGRRYERLAAVLSFLGEQGDDGVNLIAKDIANHVMKQEKVDKVVVRSRRHLLQPTRALQSGNLASRDPNDKQYFRTPYQTRAFRTDDDKINLLKMTAPGEAAPVGKGNKS